MNRIHSPLPALLGAVSVTLAAQAGAQATGGRTGSGPGATHSTATTSSGQGTATQSTSPGAALQGTPSRSVTSSAGASTATSTGSGAAQTAAAQQAAAATGYDVTQSPTQSDQQFRAQRAVDLATRDANLTGAGSSVAVPGTGSTSPGSVIAGQVVSMLPGRSVTVRDVTGLVRTFPLAPGFVLPSDVAPGTTVAVTTTNAGFVTIANATGIFPSNANGGLGEASPNLTQIVSANDSVYRPNLTTQQIPQTAITSLGGFYSATQPGAGVAFPAGTQSPAGGTYSGPVGTVEASPNNGFANDTFASTSTLANNALTGVPTSAGPAYAGGAAQASAGLAGGTFASGTITGVPAAEPITSLAYNTTALATMADRIAGTPEARLPNTALRSGALASIEGTGRDLVTRTALTTWRVRSWDGTTLVVQNDHGDRRTYTVTRGIRVPRNLQAGKLVVLDTRGETLRAVRYLL